MEPLVSVGLPVYNGERFIRDTLESICSQSYSNLEIIISDNASSDRSVEICSSFAAKDPRIAIHVAERNRGAAWNYNFVFSRARGKYFKWAAHDDLLSPRFIEECVEYLERKPDYVLAFPRTQVVDQFGKEVLMDEQKLLLGSNNRSERFLSAALESNFRHNPVFGLLRREVLAKTRLIGPFLASDLALLAELSFYGPFKQLDPILFHRRKHSGNIGISEDHREFYVPGQKKQVIQMPYWRLYFELLVSIVKSDLRVFEKLSLFPAFFRYGTHQASFLCSELRDLGSTVFYKLTGMRISDLKRESDRSITLKQRIG